MKAKDPLRLLFINNRQSKPHNKNQNTAERVWQDTQAKANNLLNWSGAPNNCWLLALQCVCIVTNHVGHQSLNWRTPIEWSIRKTLDISNILVFIFYKLVYYALEDTKLGKAQEAISRFVGFS